MKKNYPELAGKEILYKWDHEEAEFLPAKVAAVNYNDGITILATEETTKFVSSWQEDQEIMCINRKDELENWSNYTKKDYRKKFHMVTKMIQEGKVDFSLVSESCRTTSLSGIPGRSIISCAFK